jgi:hypothetical protein
VSLEVGGIMRWPSKGWKRDKSDARDWVMPATPRRVALPEQHVIDWSGVPIRDQGNRSSCVGWSGERIVRYLDWLDDKDPIDYSALFAYAIARLSGDIPLAMDEGAYIRDFYKGLRKWGIAPEELWKQDLHGTDEMPPSQVFEAAEKHQALFFYRCPSMRTIQASIAHGFPVQIGFDTPRDIFSFATQGTGEVYYPETESGFDGGGHAIVLMGYDSTRVVGSDKGAFRFANSWGPAWGDHGFGWLPFKFLEQGRAADAWSLRAVEL